MNFVSITSDQRCILYDATLFTDPDELAFDSADWAQRDSIVGFAEGRGTTFFVNHQDIDLALRHYHRGGMIARILPDRYFWTGLKRTRAWRELNLLKRMRELALPVPQPVAARVMRHGLFYTADIMTRRLDEARTVAQLLAREPFTASRWRSIGELIRRFHEMGVYHADLNANNIMLDGLDQLYLIDFDRGVIRKPRHSWQQRNLDRLRRSLDKLKAKQDSFHFEDSDWQSLMEGYQYLNL